ncbi:MAG: hypothetical protein ACAI34_02845, partial [Verrucomicrobium sp.]|nr:hypothetical protein [Verrucomicrobium sp.]
MSQPRYFLPDHPVLNEVYSKADLRAMLQSGELSRSDIVVDDETGFGHLLGDLLASPYRDVSAMPLQTTSGTRPQRPLKQEFRADTPLPRQQEPPPAPPTRSRAESKWDDEEPEDNEEGEAEDEGRNAPPPSPRPVVNRSPARGLDDDDEPEDAFLEPRMPAPLPPAEVDEMPSDIPTLPSRGGEEILFTGHPSWFSYPKSLLVAIACTCGAVFSFQQQFGLEWV